jgi:hypothetical protein
VSEIQDEVADSLREHHRALLSHLDISRERDDKITYDDAMWLMMRAAENALTTSVQFARPR